MKTKLSRKIAAVIINKLRKPKVIKAVKRSVKVGAYAGAFSMGAYAMSRKRKNKK